MNLSLTVWGGVIVRKLQKQAQRSAKTDLKDLVTFRITQLSAKMNAHSARLLREKCGLSVVQWRILAMLDDFGATHATVLLQYSGMDAGLFSRNIKSLVDSKLLKSATDTEDQRQNTLTMTAAGIRCFSKARPFMEARRRDLMKGISDSDRQLLFKIFDRLEKNISNCSDAELGK